MKYPINFVIQFFFLISSTIIILGQSNEYTEKRGGICFRTDDNQSESKYREYAAVFNQQNKNFTFALNLANGPLTAEYVNMIKSLQANGHEMLDHTPNHITNFFYTDLGTDYYVGHPGVHRISGELVELNHEPVNLSDAKRSGTVSVNGNIITSSEGIFADFSLMDCYLYLSEPVNKLVFINNKVGWKDANTVLVHNFWRSNIDLGSHSNVKFYNFNYFKIHLTVDAIKALAEETLRQADHHGIDRPASWIQPGG